MGKNFLVVYFSVIYDIRDGRFTLRFSLCLVNEKVSTPP